MDIMLPNLLSMAPGYNTRVHLGHAMDVGNNFSTLFEMLRFPSYLPAYYYFIYVHQCEKKVTNGYFLKRTMKKS